jgi:hypothetical protein
MILLFPPPSSLSALIPHPLSVPLLIALCNIGGEYGYSARVSRVCHTPYLCAVLCCSCCGSPPNPFNTLRCSTFVLPCSLFPLPIPFSLLLSFSSSLFPVLALSLILSLYRSHFFFSLPLLLSPSFSLFLFSVPPPSPLPDP